MSEMDRKTLLLNRRCMLIGAGGLGLAAVGGLATPAFAAGGLKVAAVFATPIEEPWDNQIHVALQKAVGTLGLEYKWSENVQEADFARGMREYAQKGFQLVVGDAFAAERIARQGAKSFPKIAFLFGSGAAGNRAHPKWRSIENWRSEREGAVLCGGHRPHREMAGRRHKRETQPLCSPKSSA